MFDSKDEFEVFNLPLSLEASIDDLSPPFTAQSSHNQEAIEISDDIGIQRKPRATLQELLESQPEGECTWEGSLDQASHTPTCPAPLSRTCKPEKKEGAKGQEGGGRGKKPTPPRRMRPREGPNKLKWGKGGLVKGVTIRSPLRSHLRPGPLPQC